MKTFTVRKRDILDFRDTFWVWAPHNHYLWDKMNLVQASVGKIIIEMWNQEVLTIEKDYGFENLMGVLSFLVWGENINSLTGYGVLFTLEFLSTLPHARFKGRSIAQINSTITQETLAEQLIWLEHDKVRTIQRFVRMGMQDALKRYGFLQVLEEVKVKRSFNF